MTMIATQFLTSVGAYPMNDGYTNLDAQYLAELSASFERDDPETAARLLTIAQHLQGFDNKSQPVSLKGPEWDAGYAAAMARVYGRSNVPAQSQGRVDPTLAQLMKQVEVPVRKIPAKPHHQSTKTSSVIEDIGLKIDLNDLGL